MNRADLNYLAEENLQTEKQVDLRRFNLKKKNRQKNFILVTLLIITLMLTFFVIRSINAGGESLYNLSFVTKDRIYNSISTKAIIIRDETLLTADDEGELIPLAVEGMQLAYGSKIALLAKEDIKSLQEQIANLERQIAKRQEVLIANGEGKEASQIFKRYDEQLRQQAKLLAKLKNNGNFGALNQIENYISSLLEARSIRLNKLELSDVILTELLKQRDKLLRQIEDKAKTYYLPDPGIVSYSYDGREAILNVEKIDRLSYEDLDRIYNETEEYKSALVDRFALNDQQKDIEVSYNNKKGIIARMVSEPYQIFAFRLTNEEAEKFTNKDIIDLQIPLENMNIDGTQLVRRISSDKYTFFLVKTNDALSRFLNQRYVDILVKTDSKYGFKVPNSAIQINKENPDIGEITIVNSAYARKIKIKILISNTTDSIIEALDSNSEYTFDIGSVIILNADNIKDGDKVE